LQINQFEREGIDREAENLHRVCQENANNTGFRKIKKYIM